MYIDWMARFMMERYLTRLVLSLSNIGDMNSFNGRLATPYEDYWRGRISLLSMHVSIASHAKGVVTTKNP